MAGLNIKNLTKNFGNFDALSNVTLDIKSGEFVAVLDRLAAENHFAARAIAGFEKITSGSIHVGEKVMSASDRHVAPEKPSCGHRLSELCAVAAYDGRRKCRLQSARCTGCI